MDDDRQPAFAAEPRLEPGANTLLLRYAATSSFFFASPRTTLLGHGLRRRLTLGDDDGASFGERLQPLFREARDAGDPDPIAVGALPFDSDAAPLLYVPAHTDREARLQPSALPPPRAAARRCVTQERPSAAVYADSVRRALQRMRTSELRKVVLSRALDIASESDIDQSQLMLNLARCNPAGYSFAVNLPTSLRGCSPRRLMGASPELLLERRGPLVIANPIAGTAPRCSDVPQDRARGAALRMSAKDRHEHELVVDAVLDALRPYCSRIECPAEPALISTATLWHLSTRVTGVLRDDRVSSLDLARALHPTPAVCGHPRALARDTIRDLESLPRGLFTGMVGWCDARGDGEWAVTIRCAEIEAGRARLYAGAGIVPASDPLLEVAETAAKFRAMLDALGVEA